MSERMEVIKEKWDWDKANPLDSMTIDDLQWLINQAEAMEKLGKDYDKLQEFLNGRTIRFGENVVDVVMDYAAGKEKDIEALHLTHNMQAERIHELEKDIENYKKACASWETVESYSRKEAQRYKQALEYISEIKQPDGGYVSRIEVAVTKARQALKGESE